MEVHFVIISNTNITPAQFDLIVKTMKPQFELVSEHDDELRMTTGGDFSNFEYRVNQLGLELNACVRVETETEIHYF